MGDNIKIGIVDDHRLFRKGLMSLLENFSHLDVCLEADSGAQLLEVLPGNAPDLLLLDLKMPGMDGTDLIVHLKAQYPHLKIVVLTMFTDEGLIAHIMKLGVNGYLFKNANAQELIESIETVMRQGHYFNHHVSKALLASVQGGAEQSQVPLLNQSLTKREVEVLKLICEELTNAEIADKLFISIRTVEGHRNRLLEKTEAKNTAGLVMYAIKNNLVDAAGGNGRTNSQ